MTIQVKTGSLLFRAEMVQALLDGRKTETRRVIKPQPPAGWGGSSNRIALGTHGKYGRPGDLLYVKETWRRCEVCGTVNYLASRQAHCAGCDQWMTGGVESIALHVARPLSSDPPYRGGRGGAGPRDHGLGRPA